MRVPAAVLILAGSAALGGCAYGFGDYGSYGGLSVGVGYGSGYGGYYGGYPGYGGCYDPYSAAGGYGGYDRYGFPYGGYGYGSCGYGYDDPFGWYGDYYYPGSGYYVYDRYRRPHVWNRTQQRYWTQRRETVLRSGDASRRTTVDRENWSRFDRRDRERNQRTRKDMTGDQPRTRPQ